jgi:hypothetical protein
MPTELEVCSRYIEDIERKINEVLATMEDDDPNKLRIGEALSFILAAKTALKR